MPLNNIKNLNYITKRIKSAAIKHRFKPYELSDCVQEILTRIIEGRHSKATIDQMIIDYIRSLSGRVSLKGHEKRKTFSKNTLITKDLKKYLSDNNNYADQINHKLLFNKLYKMIPEIENKVIFKMYYLWGYTELEIGDFFDLGEACISVRLKKLNTYLRYHI